MIYTAKSDNVFVVADTKNLEYFSRLSTNGKFIRLTRQQMARMLRLLRRYDIPVTRER
jgi:hypothetical protein